MALTEAEKSLLKSLQNSTVVEAELDEEELAFFDSDDSLDQEEKAFFGETPPVSPPNGATVDSVELSKQTPQGEAKVDVEANPLANMPLSPQVPGIIPTGQEQVPVQDNFQMPQEQLVPQDMPQVPVQEFAPQEIPVPEQLPPMGQEVFGQESRDLVGQEPAPDIIGSMAFNTAVGEATGKKRFIDTFFNKEFLFPAIQATIGNTDDQINSVLTTVPGATLTEYKGQPAVDINGNIFVTQGVVPMASEVAQFMPAGAVTGALLKSAGKSAVKSFGKSLAQKGLAVGAGTTTAGGLSLAGEGVREFTGGTPGLDLSRVAIETASEPLGFFGGEILRKTGGLGRKAYRRFTGKDKITGPFTRDDLKVLENSVNKMDASLENAIRNTDARDRIAEELGVNPNQLPLTIQNATQDMNLIERANNLWRMAGPEGKAIANSLRDQDKGIYLLTTEFLKRQGSLRGTDVTGKAVQESLIKARTALEDTLSEKAEQVFGEFRRQKGTVDVSNVINLIERLKKTEIIQGSASDESRALAVALKKITPEKMKVVVDVPIKTKGGSIVNRSGLRSGETRSLITGELKNVVTGEKIASKIKRPASRVKTSKGFPVDPITGKRLTQKEIQEKTTTTFDDVKTLHNAYKSLNSYIRKNAEPLKPRSESTRLLMMVKSELKKSIDKSLDGLGEANKVYIDALDKLQTFNKNIPGKLIKLSDDQMAQVGKKIFNKDFAITGEASDTFKKVKGLIQSQDPEAWRDLTATQISQILAKAETLPDNNIQAMTSKKLISAFSSDKAKVTLIKEALPKESAKTFQDIINLQYIASAGKANQSTTPIVLAKNAEEVKKAERLLSKSGIKNALVDMFYGAKKEKYDEAMGKILSSPDSVWLTELKKINNQIKSKMALKKINDATEGSIRGAIRNMTLLLDNFNEESD